MFTELSATAQSAAKIHKRILGKTVLGFTLLGISSLLLGKSGLIVYTNRAYVGQEQYALKIIHAKMEFPPTKHLRGVDIGSQRVTVIIGRGGRDEDAQEKALVLSIMCFGWAHCRL